MGTHCRACRTIHNIHRGRYSSGRKAKCSSPESRAAVGLRFKAMCSGAGFSLADVAQLLHVSPRTVHNWFSGACAVPYSSWRLIRILGRYELPDKSWAGWLMHSGKLWTPEGHPIEPRDGAWWSLLVRQARCFRSTFQENTQLRAQLRTVGNGVEVVAGAVAQPQPGSGSAPGLVPSKTSLHSVQQDFGQNDANLISDCHHLQPWPLPYASRPPSKPGPNSTPPTLASRSMPWSRLPLTPTCAPAQASQPMPHLVPLKWPQLQPCHPLRTLPQLPSHAHPRPPAGAPARQRRKPAAEQEGGKS